jgi:peptidoglycan-associated lipoprotein
MIGIIWHAIKGVVGEGFTVVLKWFSVYSLILLDCLVTELAERGVVSMALHSIGLKAAAIGAALLLLAACETSPEKSTESAGTGASTSTTDTKVTSKILPGSQEDLVANVGDRIFFGYDESDLKPDARDQVERWAAWLKANPSVSVIIEGHADERGTREYNLGLGERRADSAAKYLVALGINSVRVGTISYGKERPVCGTSNEACWSQNRRDVMMVK